MEVNKDNEQHRNVEINGADVNSADKKHTKEKKK